MLRILFEEEKVLTGAKPRRGRRPVQLREVGDESLLVRLA